MYTAEIHSVVIQIKYMKKPFIFQSISQTTNHLRNNEQENMPFSSFFAENLFIFVANFTKLNLMFNFFKLLLYEGFPSISHTLHK